MSTFREFINETSKDMILQELNRLDKKFEQVKKNTKHLDVSTDYSYEEFLVISGYYVLESYNREIVSLLKIDGVNTNQDKYKLVTLNKVKILKEFPTIDTNIIDKLIVIRTHLMNLVNKCDYDWPEFRDNLSV